MSDEASATPPAPSLWSTVNSWFTPPVLFLVLNLVIGTIAITSQLGSSHGSTHEHQKDHQEHETQKYPPAPPVARPPSIFQRLKSIIFFWNRPQEQPTWPPPTKTPEMETHHHHHQFQEPEHEQRQEGPEHELEEEEEEDNQSHFARSPSQPGEPKSSGLYSHIVIEPTATPTPTPNWNVDYPNLEPVTRHNSREEQAQAQEQQEEEGDGAGEAEDGVAINGLPRTMRRSASEKYPIVHFDEDDEEEDGDFLERRRPASARQGRSEISGHVEEEVDARADDFINRFKHQLKLQRIDSVARQNGGDHN